MEYIFRKYSKRPDNAMRKVLRMNGQVTFMLQQSGQYIDEEKLQVTAGLHAQGTKVTLQWVSAQERAHGKERAHSYA